MPNASLHLNAERLISLVHDAAKSMAFTGEEPSNAQRLGVRNTRRIARVRRENLPMDEHGPYRVYHLNRHIITLQDRDTALDFVAAHGGPDNWEILDRSDEQ